MGWKLDLVIVAVSDQERAKAFYVDTLGWTLIADDRIVDDFRVVEVRPPGSGCAIALMRNPAAAGSIEGLHVVVSDVGAARAELLRRGAEVSEVFRFEDDAQVDGIDPQRRGYDAFCLFFDPDGTGWILHEPRPGSN